MHHIDFYSIFFYANLQSALVFVFCVFVLLFYVLVLILAPYLGKLELIGFPLLLLCLPLGVSFLRTTVVERLLRN